MRVFDDFTLPGFWQDPIPVFQSSFRAAHRIQKRPDGGIAVLGYDALRAIGMHPFIYGTPLGPPSDGEPRRLNDILRRSLFAQIAPDHRRSRKAVLAGLNAGLVKAFAPGADALIGQRLATLGEEPFDLFLDLSLPVAAQAWCAFLGYAPEDSSALTGEVEAISHQLSFNPDWSRLGEADDAAASMLSRTARIIDAKADTPAFRMAQALGDEDSPALVASLLFDAIDTAAAGLAGTLAILLHEPVDRLALREEAYRELAIEEALRLATPAVLTVRQAREEAAIGGQAIPKGALVWMWWSAGNCDPDAFPDPSCFQPGRSNRGLPFGIGAHGCAGHGWTKLLAHRLVEAAFTGRRRLRATSPRIDWAIGGARRPVGQTVVYR